MVETSKNNIVSNNCAEQTINEEYYSLLMFLLQKISVLTDTLNNTNDPFKKEALMNAYDFFEKILKLVEVTTRVIKHKNTVYYAIKFQQFRDLISTYTERCLNN